MRTIEALRRSGVGIAPDKTILDAAVVMERSGVGALAVVDGQRLVGIVTDRDLVRRALANELPTDSRIDGVMSMPVVTIEADSDLHEAFGLFRVNAVRRLAVIRNGHFVGMIAVDDLLIDLAGDLADLSRPVTAEAVFGHHDSPVPVAE